MSLTSNTNDTGWAPYLDRGERILWQGQPAGGVRLQAGDAIMIPFSLAWGGFAIFWEAMAIGMGAPFPFALFGVPFVLIGLYLIVGRFFWDAYARSRTRYALTDRRALIATSHSGRRMRSYPIAPDTDIELQSGPLSSILFASELRRGSKGGTYTIRHGFKLIPDGEKVYRLIRKVQEDAREDTRRRDDDEGRDPWRRR